jgi:hypothetical protein
MKGERPLFGGARLPHVGLMFAELPTDAAIS